MFNDNVLDARVHILTQMMTNDYNADNISRIAIVDCAKLNKITHFLHYEKEKLIKNVISNKINNSFFLASGADVQWNRPTRDTTIKKTSLSLYLSGGLENSDIFFLDISLKIDFFYSPGRYARF